jgi:hypothetical protein
MSSQIQELYIRKAYAHKFGSQLEQATLVQTTSIKVLGILYKAGYVGTVFLCFDIE